MLTPQNKQQTILLWVAAILLQILITFLGSLIVQLDGTEPINWRPIILDICKVLVATLPTVGAGLVLPRIGAEQRANLINKIGTEKATEVLQEVAANPTMNVKGIDYNQLTDTLIERKRRDDLLQQVRRENS